MYKCTYNVLVFEWDQQKAAANVAKHDVDLADAATVLDDDNALTIIDDADAEERHVTVGLDALGRVLTVVYVWRGERVRLISARKATKAERTQYEESGR